MMDWIDSLREFSFGTVVLRLLLAMAAGGVIGYGRSKKQRPAGFRTYMLIGVGSAMSVLLTLYLHEMLFNGAWKEAAEATGNKFDSSRLAAQVIAGIGFLGAGIIIKASHQQVKGLTTATGLFATVCLSLAAGAGFYEAVIVALILIELVLNVMSPLEGAFKRRLRNITLNVEFDSVDEISVICDVLEKQRAQIFDIDIERSERKKDQYPSAIFVIKLSRENHSHSSVLSSVAELKNVRSVQELIS